ncbi:MAG: ParA family protein [Gammaproteobacteria bacterium]|nr:ParA family protein [Gammaproteobacteria bacterium]
MNFTDLLSGRYKPLTRHTRTIMVMNSKGGSGKTTLATNLASYFASRKKPVLLADFDPQSSSLAWLAARPGESAPIRGLAAWRDRLWIPREIDTVVMDVPAGVRDRRLARLVRQAQTIIVPVLPSALDIRAAADFIGELTGIDSRPRLAPKIAVVANRVRENTRAFENLEEFLSGLDLPVLASLRDSQNYVTAAERGIGIFELGPASVATDLEQWSPLLRWLRSRRSKAAPA